MNRIIVIIVIILGIGGLLVWVAASGGTQGGSAASDRTFSSIQEDLSSGSVLYDVRTPEEYNEGHFAGAENVPLQTLQQNIFPAVAKDTTIYVYCRSGNRSSQAAALLEKEGYTSVVDLGGLQDVTAIGGTLAVEGV